MIATGAVLASASACGAPASAPAGSVANSPAAAQASASETAQVLRATWQSYARTFIAGDGRVMDPRRNNDTTSEGQSYAMLRAVWSDDRTTFDVVWTWTRQHLWLTAEERFAYLWSAAGHVQDPSSASDADQDIALALLFAARHWNDGGYSAWAAQVLQSIWQNEVSAVSGSNYLTAGNWAATGDPAGPVLNPSYLAPYAYRIFARADNRHDWSSLVASSYRVLTAATQAPLGTGGSAGLPPNWCVLDRSSGQVRSFSQKNDGDDYGYDAFRVMWRVALDAAWTSAPEARAYLSQATFLRAQWQQHGALAPVYSHAGEPRQTYDDPTLYGGDIGALLGDGGAAQAMLRQKLLASLHQTGGAAYFAEPDNYYAQNWVWFGIALATGRLPNLAAEA